MSDDPLAALWPDASFTPIERALLVYLLGAAGRVVPEDELLREVWGYSSKARTKTIATTVRRVRAKVEPDPSVPRSLLHLRGQGYQLVTHRPVAPRRDEVARRLREWLGADNDWVAVLSQGAARDTNLPADLDAFVGRVADLDALRSAVAEGARLITIHGGAGLGKTRLSREFARSRAADFPGGVWFLDLCDATGLLDLIGALADALGLLLPARDGAGALDRVIDALRHRGPALLVFDNFEQLDLHCALAVERVVADLPGTVALVTSRARLNVRGEHVRALEPLPVDDAVTLLRARVEARRVDRGAPIDDEVLRDINALLEGVPLALEMAAARARVLPLQELRSRLALGLGDVLRLDRAGAPSRQHTLAGAIAWSWRLLSAAERDALRWMCAFEGGADLFVAERVLGVPDALDAIAELLDKSLLRAWTADGARRIGMFQAVREFVLAQAHAELPEARRRHAAWAVAFASTHAERFERDPDAGRALRRERANLVAAFEWLLAEGSSDALPLAADLRLLHLGGDQHAYARLLLRARDRLRPTGADARRLAGDLARAWVNAGDLDRAEAEITAALPTLAPGHPGWGDARQLTTTIALRRGDKAGAAARIDEALPDLRAHGTAADVARALNLVAVARGLASAASVDALREAIALADQAGIERWSAIPRGNLGAALAYRRQFDEAMESLERALAIARRFDDPSALNLVQAAHADALLGMQRFDEAHRVYTDLLTRGERHGGLTALVLIRTNAGQAAWGAGHLERAARLLELARADAERGLGGPVVAYVALAYLLGVRAAAGDLDAALRAAETLASIPAPTRQAAHEAALCLAHLDVLRARRAHDRGDHDAFVRHRDAARAASPLGPVEIVAESILVTLLARALDTLPP